METMKSGKTILLLLGILIGAAATPPGLSAQCISGTSTVTPTPGDPQGDYKYCLTVSWDTGGAGLSHWGVALGLGGCDCICEAFSFAVEDTAGVSNGTFGPFIPIACQVYYGAKFDCRDDTAVPGVQGPVVKFEHIEGNCEPGRTGTGTFCFYSDWPPSAESLHEGALIAKYGTQSCSGELSGSLPSCACTATSVEASTWGRLKKIFR